MFKIDADNNIYLTRGDSATITLAVTRNGEPYDFSNDLAQFTAKKNTRTDAVIIQKNFEGNSVTIEPSDTAGLDYQTLKFDVQITTQDGSVYTVIPPRNFTIAEEVNFHDEP